MGREMSSVYLIFSADLKEGLKSCPPTEQLVPQYQLTPRPSQFPQIWHMCYDGQHTDAMFPVSHVLTPPMAYRLRSLSRH